MLVPTLAHGAIQHTGPEIEKSVTSATGSGTAMWTSNEALSCARASATVNSDRDSITPRWSF